ncbi:MAG: glycosyltransferase family 87 protein [Acidobacteriota bacterium]
MNYPSRILLVLACSVAIGLLGLLFIRNLIDFPVYYAAGQSLISGRTDLYAPDFALGRVMDYRYPPFFLIPLTPIWLLPYSLAAYIWYVLSVLEIIGCVLIVSRTFPALRESKKMSLVVALAVVQYFVMALHYGNAHLLATFLMFASLYYVLHQKDLAAAGLMALAITIKLTPILLLPYFAVKRRWKLLAAVCVFLIAFNVAPSLYFGVRGNSELLRSWYQHVVASQEFHEDNGPINLSLKGQLRRYLSTVDYSQRVDGDIQYPSVNVASFSREQVVRAWAVLAVGLFAGVLLLIKWKQRNRPNSDAAVRRYDPSRTEDAAGLSHELALMICLTLLAAPLTSKIYFIELLWPVACLALFAVDGTMRQGTLAMRVLVVVAFVNSVLPLLPGRSVQRLLLVLGVDFYVNCLLMVGLIYVLESQRRAFQTQSGGPQMRDRSGAKTP